MNKLVQGMALLSITSGTTVNIAANTTASGMPIYYHGTDELTAHRIVASGLNWEELCNVKGAHAFWTTLEQRTARMYADINPARGNPAVLQLTGISDEMVMEFLMQEPPWVLKSIEDKGFGFLRQTFPRINATATFSVQTLTELDAIAFDEQT